MNSDPLSTPRIGNGITRAMSSSAASTGQHQSLPPWTPRAAAGRLASAVGRVAPQPGLRGPLHPSDHPRANNPLCDGQARAAIAAALLRQLFVVVTRRVAWDPAIAAGTGGCRRLLSATLVAGGANPTPLWVKPDSEQGRPAHPPPELA